MAWRDPDSEVSRFKSPAAQRIVSRTLAGDQADQNTQLQQQADENERIRKQQEDQQAALAKQQQRDAQEAQARQVRAADAAGAEIQTDIETGRRTVATHPDGGTKFKPGPLGTPVESPTINRELAAVPVIGEVVSSGALGRPAAHTGSEMVQQYQDDRGQRTVQPLPSQTDPKTAEIHQDVENPATGLKERRVIGVDTGLKAQLEQKAKLEGEQAVLDLTRNRHLQEKAAFDPQWQPVKSEYDDASREWERYTDPESRRFMRETTGPRGANAAGWVYRDPATGLPKKNSYGQVERPSSEELTKWQADGARLQARLGRAKTAYEPLRSRADGLEQREREMEMRRLQLSEQKMRLENPGLPEDDGGASSILAKSSGMVDSLPHEQTVAAVAGSGDDGFVGPPQPLLRPDFNPEAIKAAFVGLKDIDGLEIEPHASFSAINKGNEWVGNIERSDGTPLIVVREEARSTGDVGKLISFGQTKGVPVYARESAERKPLKDEAAEVATVFSTLADPALRDESGNYLPAFGQRIKELGATPEQIKARVDGGTLSVQHGEALLKAFGDTLVAPDPTDPAVRRKWLEERSRAENEALRKKYGDPRLQARNTPLERDAKARSGTSFSLADQNQLNIDYLSDQYVQNRGKPGVSRRKIQALMAKDSADSASTGEKLASMATAARNIAVNDVAAAVFGIAAGTVKDVGAAEAALFGNADAQKELAESIGLRNRDLASWTDSAKRNIKIWTSKDAAAVSQEFEAATKDFQRTIDEEEDAGRPPAKAKIAAAQQRVGAATMAMHRLAPDEAWPITEDDVDPDKNGALGLALARYKLNADPREFALFKERLLMGNGRRQFSAEMEKKLRANTLGRFGQSVTGGMYAGWQEIGTEMVADAAIAFTGGASKAAQLALRGAGAVGKAERIGALSVRFAEGIDKLAQVGIKAESLVDPLTRMDRARNAIVKGGKTMVLGGAGEGGEEVLSELGSDSPDLGGAFMMGAFGGLMLTPAFIPLERAGAATVERSNEGKLRADNEKFASKYNATMADTTGFTPISADTAATARLFRSPGQFAESAQRIEQARGEFVQYASAPEPDAKAETQLTGLRSRISAAEKLMETTPPTVGMERELAAMREREAVLSADAGEAAGGTEGKMRALRNLTDALDQEAMETESVVAAASELEGVTDPARRTFLSGVAKVATGNTNALTSTERQAVQGARTESGAPFFANVGGREVVTDEGRVEILSNHPAIGALIQTPESQAIFEALTNPTPAINENPIPTEVPPVDMPVPAVQPGDAGAAPQGDPAARPLDVEPGGGDQSGGVRDGGTDAVQGGGVRTGDPGGAAGSGPDPQGTTGGDAPAGDGGATGAQPGAAGDGSAPQIENETGPAPVEQETRTERPAVKTAYEAVQRAIVEMPSLSGRFKIDPGTATGQTAGAYATQDGIVLNLGDLEAELSAIPEGDHQARVDAVIHEEIVHFAQFEAVRRAGDEVTAFYGGLWNEFTPEQQKAAAETYQAGFEGMDDWAKAAEAVRMLIQQRSTGQVTELTKAFSKNMPERLLELLRNAVQVLKSFVTDGAIPQRVQEAIDGIEGILAEWQQESREEGGFQVETTGDTARISRGGQRMWEGPAADINAQMEKLRDEEFSPMRLSGLAIRAAAEANPKLRGKLRRQLEGLTEDIADAIGNLPAEERRGALDAAIAEWVEERSAPKPTQRTIDVPARSRAYQALNSGDYPALSAVFQSGTKIMPRPNLISLVQARKRSGARLTNREVELLRNNPEYDGAVFQNQFANSGSAKVAREIVGMIMARQGEGTRPDVVAGYLGEGVTADEMWQRVGAELNAIANGTGLAGTELDPNRERTDAEIAAELRNSDQPQLSKVEQQEENFREANVQTEDSSPIYVEDFTPESVGGTVTVDGEEMRITAVNMDSLGIEVESVVLDDHLRFGRQVLENGEAVYAESPPVEEGALFSSPSRGKPSAEVVFKQPIPGANGSVINSYRWQSKLTEQANQEGEMKLRRVSDWDQALSSAETGRDIVHQFTVTDAGGEMKTVSLESAIGALGLTGDDVKPVKSLATTLKTYGRQLLQVTALREANAEIDRIMAEVDGLPKPPMTSENGVWEFGLNKGQPNVTYRMGDTASFPLDPRVSFDPYSMRMLWQSDQVKARMREAGLERSVVGYRESLRETERRLKATERKIAAATGGPSLRSSPTPGSIRTELLSAFNLPPTRYEFRPSDETRPAILEIAAANHISLVQSADLDGQTQRFSERTGASPGPDDAGQAPPSLSSSPAARTEQAAATTEPEPTDGQIEAGNYRKGKVSLHGMRISIENARGSTRSGTDGNGKPWSVELAHHYGYFLGTEARDGDHVDVFVGPNPESTKAFVVNQVKVGTGRFDEHKVMLGFDSRKEAIAGYLSNYSPGWRGLGDIVETDVASLKRWLENGDTKKPARAASFAGIEPALSSSPTPTPETQAALETALAVMQPIYRKVYEAVSAGATPAEVVSRFKITEKAVENILNAVRSRITAATSAAAPEGVKPQMRDGKFDGGRPDLAFSTNRIVAGVDQMRNESDVPGVRSDAEVFAAAGQMLSEGYDTAYDRILEKARNLEPLSDVETEAAKRIIARETLEGRAQTAEERVKAAMLIHGYRDIGTEAARALRMRRDPHHSPAERFTQFIAEAQFSPPTETRERMRTAPKKDQQAILQGWLSRVDAIKAELRSQGLDIDAAMALFAAQKERRKAAEKAAPERAATIETAVAKLTAREKTVIEAIRGGALVSRAAYITGLSNAEVLQINGKFVKSVKDAMRKTAKQFVENSLAASPVDPLDSILAEFGIYDNALIDDTKSDFKDRRNEKLRRVSEPKKDKADAPAPPTSEQQAKWDKLAEEFFARPMSTWRTLWQDEMKKLDPVNGKNFDFKEADLIQPWKDLWQKEMPGVAWAEPQFKEWAGADATRKQAVMDLFKAKLNELRGTWTKDETRLNPELLPESSYRGEINETTGTFDIHDPVAVKRVLDAFALARGSKMDALMEYWRASILTGPQTHIVNAGSNILNAAFNLLPRRAAEATVNTLLGLVGQGSDRAATFAEFAPMARNLRKGFQLAARNAVRSWQLESRTFEAYARAESIQLDFTGVGSEYIPPALGGKIGKIMRSLSFRAMTSADEFMKSAYAQMEVAAQAHRIAAVEEKLTGKAYDARLTELMEPGSVAWIRAIDESKRVTFQEEINGADPRSIRRLDQLAELAKKGRNMPWIGRPLTFFLPFIDTPLNVFKQAVEMSPIGGALAVIDGARALHRRVRRGDLTKEQAAGDAAKLYDRARFVRDLTNQTLGVTAFIALQGLVVPDEDDEDGLPVMTGTVPYKSTKRGERDNAYAVMPPMTIRIPVLNLQFSYARIEPFATFGASMVDLLVEGNRHGGVLKPEVASQWLSRFKDQVKDKTFLQGISDLFNAIEDPDRFAERLTANIATGFIPNIIRQPIRESDTRIRDSNPKADDGFFTAVSKRIGYSVIPMAAPAKTDVWGNDIPSNRGELIGGFQATDAFFRVLDPTNAQLAPKIDPLDRWIFLYNLRTADIADRVAVQPMSNSVRGQVPGEQKMRTFPLTAEEQADANRQAGRAARALLGDGWQDAEMTTLNAKRIRDAVAEAQSSIREQIREKKIAEMITAK